MKNKEQATTQELERIVMLIREELRQRGRDFYTDCNNELDFVDYGGGVRNEADCN